MQSIRYARHRFPATLSVAVVLLAGLVVAGYAGAKSVQTSQPANRTAATAVTGKIYLLTPNTTTPAWPTYYAPRAKEGLKKIFPQAQVVTLVGDNNQEKQLAQVEAAITQGAVGVVITPVDPAQAGAALAKLAAAKIPTVAYLHDPTGGPVHAYVWVNFATVGTYFGKYLKANLNRIRSGQPVKVALIYGDPTFKVYHDWLSGMRPQLNPLVKSGKVKVVCKADTTGWAPTVAQTAMEQCLTRTANGVDAVISMNDSTSDGIWAALKAQRLNGKVPIIGGHDASLTGVQRVLAGDQVATFNFDARAAGLAAARLLKSAMDGKSAKSTGLINHQFDNGFVKGGVPTFKAPEDPVTPATVAKLVVGNRIFTKKQICTGIAAKSAFCK